MFARTGGAELGGSICRRVEPEMRNGDMAIRVGAFSQARKLANGCSSSQANGPKKWLVANSRSECAYSRAAAWLYIWRKRQLQCFLGRHSDSRCPAAESAGGVRDGRRASQGRNHSVSQRAMDYKCPSIKRPIRAHTARKSRNRTASSVWEATACKSSPFRFIFFST